MFGRDPEPVPDPCAEIALPTATGYEQQRSCIAFPSHLLHASVHSDAQTPPSEGATQFAHLTLDAREGGSTLKVVTFPPT